MNVFEMYYANGKRADFWIVRDSWGSVVARVESISGISSGPLKGLGRWPYFDKAKNRVRVELYRREQTEDGELLRQIEATFTPWPTNPRYGMLSCPGTYAYRRIYPKSGYFLVQMLGETTPRKVAVAPPLKGKAFD